MLKPAFLSASALALALPIALAAPAALAHPHVFVDAKEEAIFDGGQLVAVRHVWRFDKPFTGFAIQGLGPQHDGNPTPEELAALSDVNVKSLAMFGFFTRVTAGGNEVGINSPTEHHLELRDGRLTLSFTLPVATPVAAKGQQLTLSVFDPTYFVGFDFGPEATAELVGAPATCGSTSRVPQKLDARTMARLSTLPIDQTELPPDLRAAAALLSTQFIINCK
jgi:ABC-type uncharacterized transport system substrate-binding protein